MKIYWNRLPHCPEEQLIKKGNSTDAGYDIASAEDKLILPFNDIPYSWEEVKPLDDFNEEVQNGLKNDSYLQFSGSLKISGGVVYRKKYKFPLVKTGIHLCTNKLSWTAISLRSSSIKYGFGLANNLGVVDYSYINNELFISLFSRNGYSIINRGERIAQLIPMYLEETELEECSDRKYTRIIERRDKRDGLGSTGK